MTRATRWMAPLCTVSLLWAFNFGVNAPLASLWMKAGGASDTLVGLGTGCYYLGITLAACLVPRLMRTGNSWWLVLALAASGLTAAAFPWSSNLAGWLVLRGCNGVAAASPARFPWKLTSITMCG